MTSTPLPRRQRIRKGLLLLSLLCFPLTLYYFSPYLAVLGASEGVVSGSLIVFGLLLLGSLCLGRLWCGWACPAGGLQDVGATINDRPARRQRLAWLKWAIWLPWIMGIALAAIRHGGYPAIDPLYNLEGGLTVTQDGWYLTYYGVVALFLGLALALGRRAGCHAVCWIAPFMIVGQRLRETLRWPALRLRAAPHRCTGCLTCNRGCPMSLDVHHRVQSGQMVADDCILCGACVDNCPRDVIRFVFARRAHAPRSTPTPKAVQGRQAPRAAQGGDQ